MSLLSFSNLQTLPPISSNHRPKPPSPAFVGPAGSRRRMLYICCAEGGSRVKRTSTDDYHGTLKALNSKGRFPRKSLGQHYMLNSDINEQLAGVACIEQGDVVFEIGPGTGSLTNVLLNSGAFVLAVEKDKHMAALVSERFSSTGKFKILTEDVIKCHVRSHMSSLVESLKQMDQETRNAKVVANIPFNISTDVIKLLLPMGDIFSEVVLLLQEETALRLVVSSLRTSEYRPINIFVNFYSDPEYKFKVPRTHFFPQPNVDAAVVSFKLKPPTQYPKVSSTKSFFSMVNSAFNEKRKMLRKSLQHICTSLETEEALTSIGLLATSRPEELTMDDFTKLHNLIVK
ncbi:PREDICTED: ribosomal RNA small subunit methyltransferase, chloroplastic [Lupinus angustifolius]|uniref:ribosomal RNA small subunit methyltransferase, chloroplastic n=1 Tax=Lupinus angustifolius TaxID=3871 RepID=UPI00092F518B|nr:PREDICTED: ribosomal RNA small subunit methyltransferase, chloroplastic [Lupinus angustifolius]